MDHFKVKNLNENIGTDPLPQNEGVGIETDPILENETENKLVGPGIQEEEIKET